MPIVKFASKLQTEKFERLSQMQVFNARVKKEILDPIILVHAQVNTQMNASLAEIGVPIDGREIRLFVDAGHIFYEDEDWAWDSKESKVVERSPESKAEWLKAYPKPAPAA